MKNAGNKLLSTLLCAFTMASVIVTAQEAPPAGSSVISLTVTAKQSVRLTIISAQGTNYWIETVAGNYSHHTIGSDGLWILNITPAGSFINVYGEIAELLCSQNKANVKGLDARNHKSLKSLSCNNNEITAINVKNIPRLRYLRINNNKIQELDVSDLTELEEIYCDNNYLKELDVNSNKKLKNLYCSANGLSALNTSQNTLLDVLSCSENALSELDITNNPKLILLYCQQNKLTRLDLSNNVMLREVFCYINLIEALELSKITDLRVLNAMENKISQLDVTQNKILQTLHVSKNSLKRLDVSKNELLRVLGCAQNGLEELIIADNNSIDELYCNENNLSAENFNRIFCLLTEKDGLYYKKLMAALKLFDPQLSALLSSNAANARVKGWKVIYTDNTDVNTTGTYDCASAVPDVTLSASVYPNPTHRFVYISSDEQPQSIEVYDVHGKYMEVKMPDMQTVDCENLTPGVYFIRLNFYLKNEVVKIVKM